MRSKVNMRGLLVALALALAIPVVAIGCGGGEDGGGEGEAAQGSPTGGSEGEGPSEELINERSTPHPDFAPAGHKTLPEEKVVVESALGIDLTNSSVTMPLHRGKFKGQTVWFVITESSDFGLANDLDVNFAPKLANMSVGCPKCVQEVTMKQTPGTLFGEADVNFKGIPNFKPRRILEPGPAAGPNAFPPAQAQPGAVGDANYSPFIRIKGSAAVYNASIVAVGDGNFDVDTHSNTSDRVLSIKLPTPPDDTPSGQFKPGTVEMLLVRGRQSGQEIFYLSTEASSATAATMERATSVPLLQKAAFVGADDFLGSARERIFLFTNGQTGADNPESQGLTHLIEDGRNAEDASLKNRPLLDALGKNEGDAQNILGDFPSLADPRHATAYSPLWDAQLGEWTDKAIKEGLNTRQDDENELLNLVKNRPDLITGPLGGKYGAANFVINCPTIGFTKEEPIIAKVAPEEGGQF